MAALGAASSFNTFISARMGDTFLADLAYAFELARSALFSAMFLYLLVASVDATSGGYELLKCRRLSSETIASAAAVIAFLLSGLLVILGGGVLALSLLCTDLQRV